jgi:hypothetical protein
VLVVIRGRPDGLETEKYSIARGDLDGSRFVEAISALGSNLGRLAIFVEGWNNAVSIAPQALASIGREVDRGQSSHRSRGGEPYQLGASVDRPAANDAGRPSGP